MLKNIFAAVIISLTAPAATGTDLLEFSESRLDSFSDQIDIQRKLVPIRNEWYQLVFFKDYAPADRAGLKYKYCWVAYRTGDTYNINPDGIYPTVLFCSNNEPEQFALPQPLEAAILGHFYPSASL